MTPGEMYPCVPGGCPHRVVVNGFRFVVDVPTGGMDMSLESWPGSPEAPGYALRRRPDGRVGVVAPDEHEYDSAATPTLAIVRAASHWASVTPATRRMVAESGLRILQLRLALAPTARDVRAAGLLAAYLDPEGARLAGVVAALPSVDDDGSRATVLAAARRLAYVQDFEPLGPRGRLDAYLAALRRDGQPRWMLAPRAWRDLASMVGAIAHLKQDARLADLSCRVSADGGRVDMSASEIDELVQDTLRALGLKRRPRRRLTAWKGGI